jgi:uncharacterized membrane protein
MNRRPPLRSLFCALILAAALSGAARLAAAQGDAATSATLTSATATSATGTALPAEAAPADESGAPAAPAAAESAEASGEDATGSAAPPSVDRDKLIEYAGRFHIVVIHFPIALLMAAALAELLGFFFPSGTLPAAARYCLWLAALGALIAVPLGWAAASASGYTSEEIFWHRWTGTTTGILAWAALIVGELSRRPSRRGLAGLYRALLFAAAILVAVAAHLAGLMVNGADYFSFPSS